MRTSRQLLVVASLAALWLTRRGLTAAHPAGDDVDGHVARADWAFHLFRHGRLDGWFPTFGSGYRLFAVYGPGMAFAAGAVRLVTFGLLDTPRAFAVTGSLSIVAVPWAVAALSRELGSSRVTAAIHGVLGLYVSFAFGGGLTGLYGTGLVPQSLAVPLQVVALAGILRIARTGSLRAQAATALVVGALLLLHPISVLVLGVYAPLLVLTTARPRTWARLGRIVAALAWGGAVAAFWLLPAWATRSLRGGVSAWPTPPLPTRLGDIAAGEMVYPQAISFAVGIALALTAGRAIRSATARRLLVPPAVALAYLFVAHLALGHRWGPVELRIQFPNRGLALAAFCFLLPLADVLGGLVERRPRRQVAPIAFATVAALGLGAFLLLHGPGLGPPQVAKRPSDDLVAVAGTLHDIEPPGGRHLLVDPSPFIALGTDEPARWLAVASGRNTAHLYFPEATKEPVAAYLPGRFPNTMTPQDALDQLRREGITQIVVTTPDPASRLQGQNGYRLVSTSGSLAIYEVQPEANAPPVDALLQPDGDGLRPVGFHLEADLTHWDAERMDWSVRSAQAVEVTAAVASDPDWRVTVDGKDVPVGTSAEGLVRFALPAGRHEVRLRFVGSRNDLPAIALSLGAIGAAAWVLWPRRLSSWVRARGRAGSR